MSNKSELRHNVKQEIYVNNDLTLQEREIQKRIREEAYKERKKGKDLRVVFKKLQFNGEWMTWDVWIRRRAWSGQE